MLVRSREETFRFGLMGRRGEGGVTGGTGCSGFGSRAPTFIPLILSGCSPAALKVRGQNPAL